MGSLKPFIFWIKSKEKYSVCVRAFNHSSTTKYHVCLVIRGNNLTPLFLNQSQTASTKHTWLAALNFPRLVPAVFLSPTAEIWFQIQWRITKFRTAKICIFSEQFSFVHWNKQKKRNSLNVKTCTNFLDTRVSRNVWGTENSEFFNYFSPFGDFVPVFATAMKFIKVKTG